MAGHLRDVGFSAKVIQHGGRAFPPFQGCDFFGDESITPFFRRNIRLSIFMFKNFV